MTDYIDRVIKARRIEYGDKIKIPFDDMLKMLREKKTFSAIAERFDVSRERVRQVYVQYFADLIPLKELKAHHREKHSVRREKALAFKRKELLAGKNTPLLKLVKRVEEAGLTFKLIESFSNIYMRKTVLINGKRTRFLIGNTIRRKTGAVYNRVTIARTSLSQVDYVVAYIPSMDKFYVYPSFRVEKLYASPGKTVLCWYPDSGDVGAEYLENWNLLK